MKCDHPSLPRWDLNPIINVPIRHRREVVNKGRIEEGHVKMEAETGVMQPCAKGRLRATGSGKDKEGFSPRAFGGNMIQLTP